jgi:hypothetical protein
MHGRFASLRVFPELLLWHGVWDWVWEGGVGGYMGGQPSVLWRCCGEVVLQVLHVAHSIHNQMMLRPT